jgi:hypothetical protein
MPDPNWTDPTSAGAKLGLLTALVTVVVTPIKFFMPRKTAEAMFVKKVEHDGTRAYVHPQEWNAMHTKLDKVITQNETWQKIAKDWVERP